MASYLHPGVYIEEIPSGARPIEGVSTSVTAFVGEAHRGPAGEATLIGKWDDYVTEYGDIAGEDDHMGLAVQSFYLNGGGAAYICRLVGDGSDEADESVDGQGAVGGGPTTDPVLIIQASSVGDWGNGVYVKIVKPDPDALTFDLLVGHREDGEFVEDEAFENLTMVDGDPNYALTAVNGNSRYVELSLGDAAEIGGGGEQYQDATLTGGQLPAPPVSPYTDNYFSTNITGPMLLTVNINGLGAEQITIDPSGDFAGNDQDADGDTVAQAILDAVQAIGTADAYAHFNCIYSHDPVNRFELTSLEDGSQASIDIYDGDLAQLLRLDASQTATFPGSAVSSANNHFSSNLSGVTSLTLNIDAHGDIAISFDADAILDGASNAADGAAVALAIQNAVRAVNPAIPSYKDFTCEYTSSQEFILSSGSANARQSDMSLSGGPLATLGLDSSAAVPGRQVDQGVAPVIPVQRLGTLDQGVQLTGGGASPPTPNDYQDFYGNVLRKVRDASIIVLPGQPWPESGPHGVIDRTLAHCEAMKNRMLIIDPPEGLELEQANQVTGLGLPTSTYTVLYYPWVKVGNPFYNPDKNPNASKTLTIAPSSFAAGMWAKIDGKRGVWKAPAGVEAQLNGTADLAYKVEDLEQDQLNPLGVNCYRKIPGFGSVIWGSRTLATKAAPEWRYVPVRRTAIFIEQSIFQGIQWAVFEPNDHPLWGALRSNIGSFMNGLFRAGAFQGATAKDAYFVRCGLGDTMTQGDIDRGQVIVIVGFAPLKPAEFVIVRIQQKVGQQ